MSGFSVPPPRPRPALVPPIAPPAVDESPIYAAPDAFAFGPGRATTDLVPAPEAARAEEPVVPRMVRTSPRRAPVSRYVTGGIAVVAVTALGLGAVMLAHRPASQPPVVASAPASLAPRPTVPAPAVTPSATAVVQASPTPVAPEQEPSGPLAIARVSNAPAQLARHPAATPAASKAPPVDAPPMLAIPAPQPAPVVVAPAPAPVSAPIVRPPENVEAPISTRSRTPD